MLVMLLLEVGVSQFTSHVASCFNVAAQAKSHAHTSTSLWESQCHNAM